MVILANFAFTIDFVRRNADYTLLAVAPVYHSGHFSWRNGGPNLAKRNQFGKRSVAILGPGELIRRGNFYGMTFCQCLVDMPDCVQDTIAVNVEYVLHVNVYIHAYI